MNAVYLLLLPVVVPLIAVAVIYNRLVRLRNHCDEAWSNVDTELKRRYDLVPNLVRTVQAYANHERELMERVTELREQCVHNQGSPRQQAVSEQPFQAALHTLLARVENYPDLKASQSFLDLQHELANTEDRIQAARRFYNGNVREHNNLVQMFPSNLVAQVFAFRQREFFEIEDAVMRQAPQVTV
jgi:LemA protein